MKIRPGSLQYGGGARSRLPYPGVESLELLWGHPQTQNRKRRRRERVVADFTVPVACRLDCSQCPLRLRNQRHTGTTSHSPEDFH
ncbi:hypothetical protein VTK56DRAFT_5694 [Thermocarpiscus australiensis]